MGEAIINYAVSIIIFILVWLLFTNAMKIAMNYSMDKRFLIQSENKGIEPDKSIFMYKGKSYNKEKFIALKSEFLKSMRKKDILSNVERTKKKILKNKSNELDNVNLELYNNLLRKHC